MAFDASFRIDPFAPGVSIVASARPAFSALDEDVKARAVRLLEIMGGLCRLVPASSRPWDRERRGESLVLRVGSVEIIYSSGPHCLLIERVATASDSARRSDQKPPWAVRAGNSDGEQQPLAL